MKQGYRDGRIALGARFTSAITTTLTCLTLFLTPGSALAQDPPGVYIIFDGSGSMWGQLRDGTHKITAARDVLKKFVANDFGDKELALRAYGHNREGDCSDTELVVPFSNAAKASGLAQTFADKVNPKGKTPITRSLKAALADFGDRSGEIILISDGIETCDEDPCELVRAWMEKDVAIKVHVVGLGLAEKERAAMSCIAEAAGTEYQDAQSADELAAGLEKIQEAAGEPGPPPEFDWQGVAIKATNEAGEPLRVFGTSQYGDLDPISVGSNGYNKLPPGENVITVGVKTRNGNIYKPVTTTVTVGERGKTQVDLVVPEPPWVEAKFLENGEVVRGSHVTGYQDGEEVLSFRAKDRTHVDPGTYEFRATPNDDNELSVTETFTDGDHKEIVFELRHTVRAKVTMVSSDSGMEFVSNFELWQDGEKVYSVHRHNGVRALPGVYDLHLPLRLTPYVHKGLVLTKEDSQEFSIEVPVGHATVIYLKADGTLDEDTRIFPARWNGERWVSDTIRHSNERIPLTPGRFRIRGFDRSGYEYETQEFEISVGDELKLTFKNKLP